jgi:hypothetical protein
MPYIDESWIFDIGRWIFVFLFEYYVGVEYSCSHSLETLDTLTSCDADTLIQDSLSATLLDSSIVKSFILKMHMLRLP